MLNLTEYIHELLVTPDDYKRLDVKFPADIDPGTLSFQPRRLTSDISFEDNWDFILLMANTASWGRCPRPPAGRSAPL